MVDVVCIGEGDYTMLEFVQAIEKKTPWHDVQGILYMDGSQMVRTEPRPLLNVEELLPVPWELVNPEDYIHSDLYLQGSPRTLDIGQTSRGCPFNCGFCASSAIRKRRWRAFSSEKAKEHIISSVKRFNLSGFWLRDDEFYIKRSRTDDICRGIIDANLNVVWYTSGTRIDIFNKSSDESLQLLERSGANVLKMGAESGSDRILDLMSKGIKREDTIRANLRIRETGMTPVYALMIGFPTETWDEIHQTLDLAVQLKKDNPKAKFETLSVYMPLPGTAMWDLAVEHGLETPQTLEDYIPWVTETRDLEGKKSPWYNRDELSSLYNLSTMFTLQNGIYSVISGMDNAFARTMMKAAAFFVLADFKYRIKKRHYKFVPEALLVEKMRELVFQRGSHVFR